MKKITAILLALTMLIGVMFSAAFVPASAATSKFYFNGSMSKEVLRNYLSRAVTHMDILVQQYNVVNPLLDEDIRMLRRMGAKFVGRAATYSWNCDFSKKSEIDTHFTMVKEQLARAHKLDSEMIFQAGIFEIAYETAVNCLPIPEYVFKAFGQTVTTRNFDFSKIVFPKGTKDKNGTDTGIGCWGMKQVCGVPDITQLETKMYFYYLITRYIDAGIEAIHMGQAEKMMLYRGNSYATHWDELLTKARAYAKTNARRGVVLFDCHTAIDSGGIKVGDRLVFDAVGAGLCPNETVNKDGALQCKLEDYNECWLSWLGRSAGGTHPLGFKVDNNFTLLEFDNYNGNGKPGVATPDAFYNWGFDDITWFAMQPEWYRNQFLKETAQYLCSNWLDSNNGQQYFLQMPCHRKITPYSSYGYPKVEYTPGDSYSSEYVKDIVNHASAVLEYNAEANKYTISAKSRYYANRNTDACPVGFNQEDTIREIFLGANAAEDPELLKVTLPNGYSTEQSYIKEFTVRTRQSDVVLSSDKVISNIAKVNQGKMIDIWAGFRPAGEAADLSHLQLINGQYLILQLELDKNATSLRLQDLDVDSANKFKIEISDDNHAYYTLVDYSDGEDNANLEAKIKPQYFDNEGASAYVLSKATVNSAGKKVVYLKILAHQDGGKIRIKNFDVAVTRNKNLKFKNVERQQFIAKTDCRSDYQPNTSSPYYFNKYVVSDKSKYIGLNWMIKLNSTYTHVVFKFDLENTATIFDPYLYVAGDRTAKVKIEASKNGTSWVEIIPATVVEPNKYYGNLGTTPWTNINLTNVQTVLKSNTSKTVYLRYTYAGADKHSELQLQHFGISAEFEVDPVALGHTPGAAATCTTAQTCTGCNAVLNAALGHNYKATVTAPTCTSQGYTTHKCSRCSSSYKDTYTSAKGHTSTNGGTQGVHTKCSVCGIALTTSHSYTVDSGVQYTAATCTAKRKNYKKCSCGYNPKSSSYVVETGSVNSSNHTGSSVNGGTSSVHTKYSCCGATISSTHSYTVDSGVQYTAATCTAKRKNYKQCSCGYNPKSSSYVAETGSVNSSNHTGSSVNGGTSSVHTKYSCCGATISSTHSYTVDSGVQYTAATCTAKRKNYKQCSCGYNPKSSSYVVETGSVNSSNHSGSSTNGGTKDVHSKYSCCGVIISSTHSYTKTTQTAATCTAKGTSKYTCTCGYSYTSQDIAAKGHSEKTLSSVSATCTATGLTEGKQCTVCNTITVSQQTVAALGHNYESSVTTAPTCTINGVKTFTCKNDANHKYTEEIAATGHEAGETVAENDVAATCEANGSYDNVVYCNVCNGELSRDTITVSATGHKSGEAVVENKKAPTATEQGSYDNVVYCTECGKELGRDTVIVVYADCDGDNVCSILDLIALKKAILDDNSYQDSLDLNNDNMINSLDLIEFKKFIFSIF